MVLVVNGGVKLHGTRVDCTLYRDGLTNLIGHGSNAASRRMGMHGVTEHVALPQQNHAAQGLTLLWPAMAWRKPGPQP